MVSIDHHQRFLTTVTILAKAAELQDFHISISGDIIPILCSASSIAAVAKRCGGMAVRDYDSPKGSRTTVTVTIFNRYQ